MLSISLSKDYTVSNQDGSTTLYDKSKFDIFVELGLINPSEKTLLFNIRLRNLTTGQHSSYFQQSLSFTRLAQDVVLNQVEIEKAKQEKESKEGVARSYSYIINEYTKNLTDNSLMNDEKANVQDQLEETKILLEDINEKIALIEIPAEEIKKSDDFDSITSKYFSGFSLNDLGKQWLAESVKNLLKV